LSIQEQLASPEVTRLIKDAQDSEDEAALPRLMVALAEKVADSKIDSETKDLRAEVEQIKQHSANEGDVANRRQHMLYALKQLERMGGTERALAVQMANDSENSLLWRKLSETPAITLDHKLMVDSGMALARAVEMAGAAIEQGKGEQPASQEVVREASTTARPRASNRGQDLNQQPEQVDEADAIMKNILLGSGGSLTDSVFS